MKLLIWAVLPEVAISVFGIGNNHLEQGKEQTANMEIPCRFKVRCESRASKWRLQFTKDFQAANKDKGSKK